MVTDSEVIEYDTCSILPDVNYKSVSGLWWRNRSLPLLSAEHRCLAMSVLLVHLKILFSPN